MAHPATDTPGDGSGQPAGTSAARVLLVDDDSDVRHVVRLYLRRAGAFEIVGEAADGRTAVELAGNLQPDVVLLDVMMPGMSGHEAAPEILRGSPHSMVVMLSALAAGTQEQTALSAGAFAYIEKSTLDLQLGEQISSLLVRFRHALSGRAAWAPEGPPR